MWREPDDLGHGESLSSILPQPPIGFKIQDEKVTKYRPRPIGSTFNSV